MICLLPLLWAGPPDEAASRPVQPVLPQPESGLKFLGLVQSRFSVTNEITTNPFLDGQVVGVLGGTNLTESSAEERAVVTELRTNGFFTYTPKMLDGQASLTAAFEVDFAYGDQAYQVGGNTGGGFGADQVNLQTRRLHATFRPRLPGGNGLTVVAGLQFVSDGVYDPTTSRLDDLTRTGGGMRFFGSEAAGLTAYGKLRTDWGDRLRYKLGAYTLLEKGSSLSDDATLYMLDAQVHPIYATRIGIHGWYLRDRTAGTGGLLGSGPTSALSELQGGPRLDLREAGVVEAPEVNADLFWLGLDAGYNHRLDRGPLAVGASVVGNLGSLLVVGGKDVGVRGMSANVNARYKYTQGDGSLFSFEGLYSSADGTGRDAYTGVLTGNSYGIVGALWTTHGSYLLFPDGKAINRQVALAYDLSNQGDGLIALSGSAGYDIIPSRLNLTVGAAHARDARANAIGTELNAKVYGRPWTFLELGAVGAMVTGSSFEQQPWTSYAYLEWLVL